MRARPRLNLGLMIAGAAYFLALASPTAAHAAQPRLLMLVERPLAGHSFNAEIYISSGKPLGAYTLELKFDPGIVELERIDPGSATGFQRTPFTNPRTFATGSALFAAFQADSMDEPTGRIHVASVTLKPLKKTRTLHLRLHAVTVADTHGTRYRVSSRVKIVRFRSN